MSGPTPAPPWRGSAAPPPAPSGPAWRSPTPRARYRPRWRKLGLVALLGLIAIAAVTWVVFWIRPPAPARIVILHANYDRTLAVPSNPYGKHDARELATLAKPGSWLGTRSRLTGGPISSLSRSGLPDLSNVREKCVVVFVAAHGGRDRDGPFLFPEDSDGSPADRVRFKTLLDQLARLPANKQKLLIIDATRAPAFTELGLVHNDFAAAVEEMEGEIAAVPNLAVFLSSGPDERSWTSPEWGTSAFAHFAMRGLNGDADADGNKRVSAGELVSYITPRVSDWVRDNRGARQVPILLPKADGANRVNAMHLVSVDIVPGAPSAPEPFEPPPELKAQWDEYRALAQATPPPTAYTPHLWRQYEAWALRHEELILANDTDGAKIARANAAELRRKIEAARTIDVAPQTLTIQAAVAGQLYVAKVPEALERGIKDLAREPAASRAKLWTDLRAANGDNEPNRLLWCRALIEWVAGDPVDRLPVARDLIPLVADGFAVRPAELNFVAMLARHLPPPDKKDILGPLLTRVLTHRLKAEEAAAGVAPGWEGRPPNAHPFAEFLIAWDPAALTKLDELRRVGEDICFATEEANWKSGVTRAEELEAVLRRTGLQADSARRAIATWHRAATALPGTAEWAAQWFTRATVSDFNRHQGAMSYAHQLASVLFRTPVPPDLLRPYRFGADQEISTELNKVDTALTTTHAELFKAKPEFDAKPTPRADVVKWWNTADALLTAPPPPELKSTERVALAREFRRVSRQLLVTNETQPEALPEVTAAKAREIAFETANRRGILLISRLGHVELRQLVKERPGEDSTALYNRLDAFAFQANGRASLATFGSRCGELFDAAAALATKPDAYREADRWVRISPAHAAVSDAPIERVRRERVRGYLAWQAQRTYSDHWYGEAGTRYYHLAIQQLANDANALVSAWPASDEPFKPLLGVERPFPVSPKFPMPLAITDEPNPAVRITFDATPTPGVEGLPVFWIDPKVREPISTTPKNAALVRSLTRPAPPQPLAPKAQSQPLAVGGFFRGRTLDTSTSVDFYAVPDRAAVSVPLPQTVSIAVRADANARKKYGFANGAVAIVLDCSGSMGRDPKDPKSVGLYPEAVDALAKLLTELPPGTQVTVWTFGQKTTGAKTPEDTIRELLPLTTLSAESKPVIDDALSKARGLEPWHESPVTRAAVAARNRIVGAKVPFKAVVLISDAVDNRFAVDPEYGEKKRTIGDVLRAEFPPEVAFGVVAFPVGKEEQAVQGEFQIVEKLMPQGKFVPPDKVSDLIDWLRTGVNPRVRFTLEPLTSDTPAPGGLMAGTAETDNWYSGKLAPGKYRFRLVGDSSLASDIALSPGDRILLDVTESRGVLSLSRHWFANTVPAVAKAGKPDDAWRMALLQNRAKGGALDLFTMIESDPAKLDRLAPTRIGDVWFEVTPSVPKPEPLAIRWRAEGGFPAPSWSLDSPGWPNFPGTAAHAAPRVTAWWAPEPFAAAARLDVPDTGPLSLRDRSATVAGSAITLETGTLEEHEIEVASGERAKRMCLVVRLAHPTDAPVFVRLAGAKPSVREVRVWKGASKTTSLFWWPGLSEADVKAKVTGFEFVPLNDALRAAEKAGRRVMLTAPAPTDTSAKPEPPTK